MQSDRLSIRAARNADLDAINRIVEQAVWSWNLPERVKRLVIPSYHYSEWDLRHMQMVVAEQQQGCMLGVVAWEVQTKENDAAFGSRNMIILHGLFVEPEHHRKGIGGRLLAVVEAHSRTMQSSGILVKAQADASRFFQRKGYHPLVAKDSATEYPLRYWKPIS